MKKESTSVLTAEQRREITVMASQVAVEQYRKEAERMKKEAKDNRLHNTKLLMEKYRGFVIHSQSAVYDAVQIDDDLSLESLLEIMGTGRTVSVTSIQQSAARTRVLVHHIDRMLDYFKFCCCHSAKPEEMRRYRVIYYSYIAEESEQKSFQELADEEKVDISTIYKDHKAALSQLSALLFGFVE